MYKKIICSIAIISLLTTGCSQPYPPNRETTPPRQESNQPELELERFMRRIGAAKIEGIPFQDIQSVTVLVNKQNSLPSDYVPPDLVEVNIPFTFKEKDEKRMLRQEAAEHLENLFSRAKEEGVFLYGVSGYRSYQTQKALFSHFTSRFGSEEEANQISARPGESEHQAGLAMDVTAQSVNYGLVATFSDTAEYDWLEDHAHEYGYIVRYLQGKEYITEYTYEPWHLRYIGVELATKLYQNRLTYEEYLFLRI